MRPSNWVVLLAGCLSDRSTTAALHPLDDPCDGRNLPVLAAIDDQILLLGCSGGGGLWWSRSQGDTFQPVEGAEATSVLSLTHMRPDLVLVVAAPGEPPVHAVVHSPQHRPIQLRSSPAPLAPARREPGTNDLDPPVRDRVVLGRRILEVGRSALRPSDGAARWSTDAGRSWQVLPGSPPVLEAATATESTFWIGGDDVLIRGRW